MNFLAIVYDKKTVSQLIPGSRLCLCWLMAMVLLLWAQKNVNYNVACSDNMPLSKFVGIVTAGMGFLFKLWLFVGLLVVAMCMLCNL